MPKHPKTRAERRAIRARAIARAVRQIKAAGIADAPPDAGHALERGAPLARLMPPTAREARAALD